VETTVLAVLAFGVGGLLSLVALTIAPYAPWPSDRSMIERNGSRIRRHNPSRA
jgi:hypothetical protein